MKKYNLILSLIFVSTCSFSQNISSAGNWSNTASWDAGNIGDLVTENVTMNNSLGIIVIQNTESYTIGNFDMGNSNTLTIDAGGSLTLGAPGNLKTLTTNNSIIATIAGDLTVYGDITINNNLLFIITGNVIVTGSITLNNGAGINVSGALSIGGDFSAGTNTSLDVDGTVTVGGNFSVGNGSTATGTGLVSVTGICNDGTSSVCSSALLPVELLYFYTEERTGYVNVRWSTASEENNDFFTIERSSDGSTFHELAMISGAGTSLEKLEYNYTDKNPFEGVSYYRLKQTNFDGTTEIFHVEAAEFYGHSETIRVTQYINNVNILKIYSNLDEENVVTIYSAMGKISKIFTLHQGENTIDLTGVSNNNGIYIIRVVSALGKVLKTERILISN